ncbi:MAG: CarD family transcriptional regulator, partial [Solirubrobacterales bacterium]
MNEATTNPTLRPLLELAYGNSEFRALADALAGSARDAEPVASHMSPGIRPYLLAALLESVEALGDRPALLATADDRSARDLAVAIGAYLAPRRVRYYPSRGTGFESHLAPPPHLVGLRIAALDSLTAGPADGLDGAAPVVVASAIAMAEMVPDEGLRPGGLTIHRGEEVGLDDLAELLVGCGYEFADQVEDRGQFAVRGGILDVFGATEDHATRLDFFGDEVESMRRFSTFTQRSLGETELIEIAPAAEVASSFLEGDALPVERFRPFLDLIPADTIVVNAAADEIGSALADHRSDVEAATHGGEDLRLYTDAATPLAERSALTVTSEDSGQAHSFRAAAPVSAARTIGEAEGELSRQLRAGYVTVVPFEHHGEAERARYNLDRLDATFLGATVPPEKPVLYFTEAPVSDGFVSPDLKLVVFPYRRLVHRRRDAAPAPARGPLAAFGELRVGDLVVHEDHGIARFTGFDTKTVAGITRDYLALAYRGEDRVFVPADQLAKISNYVGASGADPELSALGGKRWAGVKARAESSARALAGELLNLYAERQTRR